MDYSYNIKNLCVKFDDRQILKDLSFSLSKGLCVIKGKSGCGKSTLIDILLGLRRPDKGKVFCLTKIYMKCLLQKEENMYLVFALMLVKNHLLFMNIH